MGKHVDPTKIVARGPEIAVAAREALGRLQAVPANPALVATAAAKSSDIQGAADNFLKQMAAMPAQPTPLQGDRLREARKGVVQAGRVNLTESDVQSMFMKRLGPSLAALTSQAESLGKTLTDQVQGDLLTQHKTEFARTRQSLENGVLDTLVANITGILAAAADVLKGVGEQVSELYAKDRPGVLNFATQLFHIVKEGFTQVMNHNPMMRMAMMMSNFGQARSISDLLPAANQQAINVAPNAANN